MNASIKKGNLLSGTMGFIYEKENLAQSFSKLFSCSVSNFNIFKVCYIFYDCLTEVKNIKLLRI